MSPVCDPDPCIESALCCDEGSASPTCVARPLWNEQHCGACGNACGPLETCVSGVCELLPGEYCQAPEAIPFNEITGNWYAYGFMCIHGDDHDLVLGDCGPEAPAAVEYTTVFTAPSNGTYRIWLNRNEYFGALSWGVWLSRSGDDCYPSVAAGDVPLVCGLSRYQQSIPTEWTGELTAGQRILVFLSDDWCATHPGTNNEHYGVLIERL